MNRLSASLLRWGLHPLSLLWLLCALAGIGGLVEWLFLGGLPWEALTAAAVLAGVTSIAAHVKGIPAWPWSPPEGRPPDTPPAGTTPGADERE